MKIKSKIFIILLVLLIISSCTSKQNSQLEGISFTIIHVNDRHGRMDADPYISQLAKELTAQGEKVYIFDAGDALHGQITSNITKGESMIELMNAVGYTAMVTGNHEYNFGVNRLLELDRQAYFPILAANVTKDGYRIFSEYLVSHLKDIKIGVFGIVTPETPESSDPREMAGLEFEDPFETAERMVDLLQEMGCDYIVAISHLGDNPMTSPQNRVDAIAINDVDLIIDGHSHTLLPNGRRVNNTLIVQAGEHAKHIGIVKVRIQDKKITQTAYTIEVNDNLKADESIVSKINELNKSIEDLTNEIVGYTPYFLDGERLSVRTSDTNLTNLITDSMRYISNADIAFISGGSIRASIPAGDIAMSHVLTTLPFSNLVLTMELNGNLIYDALKYGVSAYPEDVGFFLQFSGLKVIINPNTDVENRIVSVEMQNGIPFDKNKTYVVAMIEFLAAGGDGYDMFLHGNNQVFFGGNAEAFVEYLKTNPEIYETGDGRLIINP